jgi:YjjG family noncanonical pyrimidine nucleotidase
MSAIHQAKNYKYVFFDLDHTLWDYEKNAQETLLDLYNSYNLSELGVPDADTLYHRFRTVNIALWDLYDRNLVDQAFIRTQRFKQILDHFGAYQVELSERLSSDYLDSCPKKQNLIPFAHDVLEYLSGKYHLTVVTNGFEEIQNVKLSSGSLHRYFKHIVTSQKAGHKKPSQKIFEFAMTLNNADCGDVVMIGDNLVTDIGGARGASIDTIFFNRDKIRHSDHVNYEITCLSELTNIL